VIPNSGSEIQKPTLRPTLCENGKEGAARSVWQKPLAYWGLPS
jgi:hypothetical protein